MSVTLATAYVELIPTTRGIESAVQKQFEPAQKVAEKAGRDSGEQFTAAAEKQVKRGGGRFGDALKNGLVGTAKVTGAAVAGILGFSLAKGFSRLTAIEDAKAKLKGFGNDSKAVTEIMKNSLASVKGTAFGLDEAATTAATAVSAGIKPGKNLERVLKVVANSAGAAGTSMGEMGSIFNKVATSGKAQNDVLGQVADRGIDIYGALAKQLGVTADEVFDMAKKGKIDFATFEKAMSSAAGTAADEMGKTTTGALKNLGAALGRFGAGLLGGVFPLIGPLFSKFTGWIDIATEKVGPLATAVSGDLAKGLGNIWTLLATGDFKGPIFGQQEDSVFVDWLFRARDAMKEVKGGIIAFAASWKYNDGEITSAGFPGFMEQAAFTIHRAFDGIGGAAKLFWTGLTMDAATRATLTADTDGLTRFAARVRAISDGVGTAVGQLDFSSWSAFTSSLSEAGGTIGQALGPALDSMGRSMTTLAPAAKEFAAQMPDIGGAAAKVAAMGLEILTGTLGFLADHVDTIIKFMPLIVAGFVAWRIASFALANGTLAMQAASVAMTPVITLNNILRLTAIRLENKQTIASARNVVATTAQTSAENLSAAARTRSTLATTALEIATGKYTFKTIAASVASKTAAAGQWLLNAALSANPIGLVVLAIAGLVAGLVWFFTQTEVGQQIIAGAWSAIQTAIGAVSGWFTGTVLPALQTALGAIGSVFQWLWTSIVQPVFSFIGGAITAMWMVGSKIFEIIVAVLQKIVGPAISAFWTGVVQPVFNWIGSAISTMWAGASVVFGLLVGYFNNVLGPIFNWLWKTIIKPAFDGIGAAVKWVWEHTLGPVFDTLKTAIEKNIPKAFDAGVKAVKTAWDAIQDIAKAPVKFVVNTIINDGLIAGINGIAQSVGVSPLPKVALPPGFADGGWTGPGGKNQTAGVVHADEFVIPKDARRKVEASHPGALSYIMRTGSLPGYAGGGRVQPLKDLVVTQGYNRTHKGIDYAAGVGTPVYATEAGTVSFAGEGARSAGVWGGNEVHLAGGSGIETWYAHLSRIMVGLGDQVRAGQQIAASGNSGITSGPHLHFGTFAGGWPNDVDPTSYLGGAGRPGNPLAGLIEGLVAQARGALPQNVFTDLAIGAGESVFKGATDWVWDKLGGLSDVVRNVWHSISGQGGAAGVTPTLYDNGGLLQPGLTLTNNQTGRPEPILTGKQWDALMRDRREGGRPDVPEKIDLHVHGDGLSEQQVGEHAAKVILGR